MCSACGASRRSHIQPQSQHLNSYQHVLPCLQGQLAGGCPCARPWTGHLLASADVPVDGPHPALQRQLHTAAVLGVGAGTAASGGALPRAGGACTHLTTAHHLQVRGLLPLQGARSHECRHRCSCPASCGCPHLLVREFCLLLPHMDLRGEEASSACCCFNHADWLPEAQEVCSCSTTAHRLLSAIVSGPCC